MLHFFLFQPNTFAILCILDTTCYLTLGSTYILVFPTSLNDKNRNIWHNNFRVWGSPSIARHLK